MTSDKFLATTAVVFLFLVVAFYIVSQHGIALMLPSEVTKILELLNAA